MLRDISLTSDELGAGVFVDLCHVDDCASLLGVAQGAETFLDVAPCWAESGNHGCFGITTETLFQQPAAENIDCVQNGPESRFKSLAAYYSVAKIIDFTWNIVLKKGVKSTSSGL